MSDRPEVGTAVKGHVVAVRFEAGRESAILRIEQYDGGTDATTTSSVLVDLAFAREVATLLDATAGAEPGADTLRVRITLDVFGGDS